MTDTVNTVADTIDINEQLTSLLGGNPFDIRYIGKAVDLSSGRPWEHDRWEITLRGCPDTGLSYSTGLGRRKKGMPVKPSLADILYSLFMYSHYTEYSLDELAKELEITVPSKAVAAHVEVHHSAGIYRKAVPAAVRGQVEALLQDY
jgi:hypothetical protein